MSAHAFGLRRGTVFHCARPDDSFCMSSVPLVVVVVVAVAAAAVSLELALAGEQGPARLLDGLQPLAARPAAQLLPARLVRPRSRQPEIGLPMEEDSLNWCTQCSSIAQIEVALIVQTVLFGHFSAVVRFSSS